MCGGRGVKIISLRRNDTGFELYDNKKKKEENKYSKNINAEREKAKNNNRCEGRGGG